jgi:transcription elongation GreA/GreB family factor
MDSPIARALMRRGNGDEFTVEVPGGQRTYVVTEIRYETDEGNG